MLDKVINTSKNVKFELLFSSGGPKAIYQPSRKTAFLSQIGWLPLGVVEELPTHPHLLIFLMRLILTGSLGSAE